jgi:class 3 adenylate cyclase
MFMEQQIYSARRGRAEWAMGTSIVAVAFVDLVESTSWAAPLSPLEHAAALQPFADAAWRFAAERGVRLVKLIGDEAMFVGTRAEDVCSTALDMCEFVYDQTGLPEARGAVGFGEVHMGGGDYQGGLLNVIARATKSAAPSTVVVTPNVLDRARALRNLVIETLPQVGLPGFPEPIDLAVLRRPST